MTEESKDRSQKKGIKLTEEKSRELDHFIGLPLRSANRLIEQLFANDDFYESTTYAWVGEKDAKRLFLFGVCKEVIKVCVSLMNEKEFLQEVPSEEPDRMGKIITGSITDAQDYRIRKMVELLSTLILFDRNTKRDEEYRIYLSAENLDLYLSRQQDFKELYEGRIVSNIQSSIDDFTNRIKGDLKSLGVQEIWFLNSRKFKERFPSVFKSKRALYLSALLVATPDEQIALGISYGRGYSRISRSVHLSLGSHDYGKEENDVKHVISNFSYLSIICMNIMHLAYKIAGLEDPEGLSKVMGENFEKSHASKNLAQFKKELEIGDLIFTMWTDIAVIVDEHTSKYGYKAYKIKYLLKPPLPEFPEDWIESSNILARLMTKGWVRQFYEKNASLDKMPPEVKEIWPKVMEQSDEKLMESAIGSFVEMHKHGILVPALMESGFLKKREES